MYIHVCGFARVFEMLKEFLILNFSLLLGLGNFSLLLGLGNLSLLLGLGVANLQQMFSIAP